tara:strand:+ start:137 stop:877 length:741 start_codon:yes stop_codon:yes gene_type:complete
MNWTDEGLLLSVNPHGEKSAILQVLTRTKGLHAGIIQNAFSKKMSSILQPSSQLQLDWSSRLEEHLGTYKVDLLKTRVDIFLSNKIALDMFNSISSLCISILAERDPMPEFYEKTINFLDQIVTKKNWEFLYLDWELQLLTSIGYGLDLKKCVASGSTENLFYISPKSGKAVSREIGLKYDKKLLRFPSILRDKKKYNDFSRSELVAGLSITGFFLKKWLTYSFQNKQTMKIRQRLIDTLSNEENT